MAGSTAKRAGRYRTAWAWARLIGGVAVLAVLIARVGIGPIVHGLRTAGPWTFAAVAGLTLVTTLAAAWRWTIVARGLGVPLPLGRAVAAYYRSQFLNTTLPGGVLGDVHRGVAHGHDVGDLNHALRAVAWERAAGQVVQGVIALVVLATMPSPVRSSIPVVLTVLVVAGAVLALSVYAFPSTGVSRRARTMRAAAQDLRRGLLARDAWRPVLLASVIVVVGHTGAFLIAVRASGTDRPLTRLVPIAMLVLLASSVPTNIGGWGPREGVSAWVFAAAGLGAAQGVSAASAYGLLVIVACLPGAGVLIAMSLRRQRVFVAVDAATDVRVPAGVGHG